MALAHEEVVKAVEVLRQVNPGLYGISEFNKESYEIFDRKDFKKKINWPINKLMAEDRKQDGWESIWVCIEDISTEQRQLFEALKSIVANTSFVSERDDDAAGRSITMIGFF